MDMAFSMLVRCLVVCIKHTEIKMVKPSYAKITCDY